MKALQFNVNGYLEPYEAIQTDMVSIKPFLVWNEARGSIWGNFEAFICELQSLLESSFYLWLNGSFATQKETPNDMDIVVFVDFQVYDAHEKALAKFKTFAYRKTTKLDVYFVRTYPETHERKLFEDFDRIEWLSLFSKTRTKEKKGFLELKF